MMSKSDEVHCFIGNSVGKVGDAMKRWEVKENVISSETTSKTWRKEVQGLDVPTAFVSRLRPVDTIPCSSDGICVVNCEWERY